jgi:hypothetical protein
MRRAARQGGLAELSGRGVAIGRRWRAAPVEPEGRDLTDVWRIGGDGKRLRTSRPYTLRNLYAPDILIDDADIP